MEPRNLPTVNIRNPYPGHDQAYSPYYRGLVDTGFVVAFQPPHTSDLEPFGEFSSAFRQRLLGRYEAVFEIESTDHGPARINFPFLSNPLEFHVRSGSSSKSKEKRVANIGFSSIDHDLQQFFEKITRKPLIRRPDNANYGSVHEEGSCSRGQQIMPLCRIPGHDPGEASTRNHRSSDAPEVCIDILIENDDVDHLTRHPAIRGLLGFTLRRLSRYATKIIVPASRIKVWLDEEAARVLRLIRPRINLFEGALESIKLTYSRLFEDASHVQGRQFTRPCIFTGLDLGLLLPRIDDQDSPPGLGIGIPKQHNDFQRIVTFRYYQPWKEYGDRLFNETSLALAGQAVGAVMNTALTRTGSSTVHVVEAAVVLGLSFTMAGISLRRKRRVLAILMLKLGTMVTASAIVISLGSHLPPALGWTVGLVAVSVMAMAIILAG